MPDVRVPGARRGRILQALRRVAPARVPAAALVSAAAPAATAAPPVPPVLPLAPRGKPVTTSLPVPPDDFGAPDPALSSGRGRTSFERDYWTPSDPPAPAKRASSTPRSLLILVSVLSMALGWVAFDHIVNRDSLPPGTSAFVAGHGVAYTSPDHTFDAQFPRTPTVDHRVLAVSTTTATLNLAQDQTDDYEVVAASLVLPVAVPAGQVDTVLHEILNSGAASQGDTITSEAQRHARRRRGHRGAREGERRIRRASRWC